VKMEENEKAVKAGGGEREIEGKQKGKEVRE
jgi:hypothetical protein